MNMPLLQLNDVEVGYGGTTLLSGAQCSLEAGQVAVLTGRNGTGKSTLLRALAGITQPRHGEVLINGQSVQGFAVKERARHVALVNTQRLHLAGITALQLVAMGRYAFTGSWGYITSSDERRALRYLSMLGIDSFAPRSLASLSDGELQKVMIARALAQEASVLLMDEPTAYLDYVAREELMQLIERIGRESNSAIVFSTHELALAAKVAHVRWHIEDRQLQVLKPDVL